MNALSQVNLNKHWASGGILVLAIALVVMPANGQDTNFGKLAIGPNKTSGVLTGSTGGSTSLPAIVSNSDRRNAKCLGFGDPKPDHLLILQQDFPNLSVQVNSGGADTTLVIQGPSGMVRCGDDTGSNKDASITDANWKSGKYKVWVGTAAPGIQRDYTLTVQP